MSAEDDLQPPISNFLSFPQTCCKSSFEIQYDMNVNIFAEHIEPALILSFS